MFSFHVNDGTRLALTGTGDKMSSSAQGTLGEPFPSRYVTTDRRRMVRTSHINRTTYIPPSEPTKSQLVLGSLQHLVDGSGKKEGQHNHCVLSFTSWLAYWIGSCAFGVEQPSHHSTSQELVANRKDKIGDRAALDPNLLMTKIRSSYRS
ncbi:predicted protein [Botrytis cinerea T4]|uniref:Uncharacterized protein n=1 Tax=Botryotinia fuckeliana (strain T4) TaxID=999810 RepID=G2YCU6_BOTF4|nr:predicted protein [Botrytis cinerea T4]